MQIWIIRSGKEKKRRKRVTLHPEFKRRKMINTILAEQVVATVNDLYNLTLTTADISLQKTRKEFVGDYTVVVFPFVKAARKSPVQCATEVGEALQTKYPSIESFNVIQGFLNIVICRNEWLSFFSQEYNKPLYGYAEANSGETIVVEYSSPNTNKPLHLGHVRNNLLGFSVAQILKATGKKVIMVNLVNDRGVHICKSMLAWMKWGNGETPASSGLKGDHLIGKYYVLFDKYYKEEIAQLVEAGMKKEEAEKTAPLMLETQEMLRKWEQGDAETISLWKTMNSWAYAGFDETYKSMGVTFDKIYHESETYLLGKDIVQQGVDNGVLFKKEDGSVWCDLTGDGLDEKLLLRSDGTSVYMTQDLGTARMRYEEFKPNRMVYVVGNEQDYHFNVLRLILKKMGYAWADGIYHLSYGMVELPHGKMKSREGTVVDADDLIEGMIQTAREMTEQLGKLDDFGSEEASRLYYNIGMGALKYYILKVDPKKTMLFNPEESIDFNGNTGPFIQYTHARICSILRKAAERNIYVSVHPEYVSEMLGEKEKDLVRLLHDFPGAVEEAGKNFSPALVANYIFELAKEYNQFYHDHHIMREENEAIRQFRLDLSFFTANVIRNGMKLLGVEVPEKM
jgi:arginyl-tRNA synthetase